MKIDVKKQRELARKGKLFEKEPKTFQPGEEEICKTNPAAERVHDAKELAAEATNEIPEESNSPHNIKGQPTGSLNYKAKIKISITWDKYDSFGHSKKIRAEAEIASDDSVTLKKGVQNQRGFGGNLEIGLKSIPLEGNAEKQLAREARLIAANVPDAESKFNSVKHIRHAHTNPVVFKMDRSGKELMNWKGDAIILVPSLLRDIAVLMKICD